MHHAMMRSLATPTIELPDFVPAGSEAVDALGYSSESSDGRKVESFESLPEITEPSDKNEAAIPTVDSLTDFLPAHSKLDTLLELPELPEEDSGASVMRSVYHSRGYHIGKPVTIRNHITGSKVDAVVIDSNGELVKLFYMIGQRCYTQVAASCVLNMGMPASKKVGEGANVQVRSATANAWFHGTVMWSKDGFVKVLFKHNGRSCTKILPRNSPDLRVLSGTTLQTPADGRETFGGLDS